MSDNLQITSFDWFINREKDRPCLIAGTAPSVLDFPFKEFNGVYIVCGDAPVRLKKCFKPNYWVNANTFFPIPEKHLEIINCFTDMVFIFSDTAAYSYRPVNINYLRSHLKVNWFAFDHSHFDRIKCENKRYCCELLDIYPERITIQEYFQKRYNLPGHYSTASTGAIHALTFAILLGCSPIYLHGIEIPKYSHDYVYAPNIHADLIMLSECNNMNYISLLLNPRIWKRIIGLRIKNIINKLLKTKSAFNNDITQILLDFQYLVDLANNQDIEIYNLSKTSALKHLKNLRYLSPNELKVQLKSIER
jgi:hypothetical protein